MVNGLDVRTVDFAGRKRDVMTARTRVIAVGWTEAIDSGIDHGLPGERRSETSGVLQTVTVTETETEEERDKETEKRTRTRTETESQQRKLRPPPLLQASL